MENQNFKWITTHTETRMIHDFGSNHVIVLNKENNQATKLINGKTVCEFDTTGMLLETYEQILIAFAESI